MDTTIKTFDINPKTSRMFKTCNKCRAYVSNYCKSERGKEIREEAAELREIAKCKVLPTDTWQDCCKEWQRRKTLSTEKFKIENYYDAHKDEIQQYYRTHKTSHAMKIAIGKIQKQNYKANVSFFAMKKEFDKMTTLFHLRNAKCKCYDMLQDLSVNVNVPGRIDMVNELDEMIEDLNKKIKIVDNNI